MNNLAERATRRDADNSEVRRGMETGEVVVERVEGKSTVIRCFSTYPLKFIVPNKVFFLF